MLFVVLSFLALFVSSSAGFAASDNISSFPSQLQELEKKFVSAVKLGNYDQVRTYHTETINLLLAHGRPQDAGQVDIVFGEISVVQGAFPEAEAAYKKGIELLKRSLPPNDLRMVVALDDLGWLYMTWGRFDDGSRLMEQARFKADRAVPNDPAQIRHLDIQAAYLMVAGRFTDAREDWKRALDIGNINYGPDSRKYDNVLVHFGQGSSLFGDYKTAEDLFQRYLHAEGDALSSTPLAHALVASELGHIDTRLHKYAEAQDWFNTANGLLDRNPGQAPLLQSIVWSYLGDYYMQRSDWTKAEAQYRRALDIQQKTLGDSRAVAASMISLSKALKKCHLKKEAQQLLARARVIVAATHSPLQNAIVDVMSLRQEK